MAGCAARRTRVLTDRRCGGALTRRPDHAERNSQVSFGVDRRTIKVALIPPEEATAMISERTALSERTPRFERT
jgi:hypothetical protein